MRDISEFEGYQPYLQWVLGEKQRLNEAFSLRAFARSCEISPSALSRIISGKRKLSPANAWKIGRAIHLTPEQNETLQNMVAFEFAKPVGKTKAGKVLSRRRQSKRQNLSDSTFQVIADWYHFAILALTNTKDFRAEPLWIANRLGISSQEATSGLSRLVETGLLKKTAKGYRAKNDANVETTPDLASAAARENHRQQLEKAGASLQRLGVDQREFMGLTLAMNRSDIPEAKKRLRCFMNNFNADMERKGGEELFQLNLQFYLLTKGKR